MMTCPFPNTIYYHHCLLWSQLVQRKEKGGGIFSYDFPTESHLAAFTAVRSCLAVCDFTLVVNYLEFSTSPADWFL